MKYRYKLSNLDCANCANKIEQRLKNDKNIIDAGVNFSKLSLFVETNMEDDIKKYVTKIVKSIEPDVCVLDKNEINDSNNAILFHTFRLIIGIIFSIFGIFLFKGIVSKLLIILGYFILLYRTFTTAIKLLFKSRTINENLLVTISCIGAYLTNNINEGLMVIILYEIGKILEELAVNNSRKSISNLMDIKPLYANLKNENGSIRVNPLNVKIGDIIIVKKGEKIPLDGIIIKGSAKINTSALTGESKIKKVRESDEVLSGCINEDGLIEVKVTCIYDDSTVSRILNLVERATDRKAKTENFVAKAAKIYTPVILLLAILVIILFPIIFNINLGDAVYRALVFLVISCPCAIAISVPLSYFSGIGKASKEGILIKGSDYLDLLGKINKIIFDKTGTITTGKYSSYKLTILDDNYKKEDIIKLYVKGEKLSNHPIAKGVISVFNDNEKTDDITDFKEISGKGISYKLNGDLIKIGSSSYLKVKEKSSLIYLSINNKLISKLELKDGVKKNAKQMISKLKSLNIKTLMFTGDEEKIAREIGGKVEIDEVKYELLPQDKYELLEKELENNKVCAFVGDGINDAPSLRRADIGISMGQLGSYSAIEASDVVIMNDDLDKIIEGIKISRKTNKIIKQNLGFAIGIKVLVLILSSFGIASMWQAVFADTGVTLLTILNTTRILKR